MARTLLLRMQIFGKHTETTFKGISVDSVFSVVKVLCPHEISFKFRTPLGI